MIRSTSALFASLFLVVPALGHFVFVVPRGDGKDAQVVFSDDLQPDEAVSIDKIAAVALVARDAKGADTPLKATAEKHALAVAIPQGTRFVFGDLTYGVMQKGKGGPYLLRYHANASLGDAFDGKKVGDKLPLEVVPVGAPGNVRFQALAKGKPLPAAEFTVIMPGGDRNKLTADADGLTPVFAAPGRYGVWTKFVDKTPGEHGGKKFDETRHYGTLVVEISGKK